MTVTTRALARKLVRASPASLQRAVTGWMTSLHASAAAKAAVAHELGRRAALARAEDWGFFTLYLPGVEHPLYARPGTSDLASFSDIFGRRQAVELGFEPRTIIDLGANVGYATVDLALRYPGSKILAVEPERSNVELLRQNVAGFDVEVVEAAAWPRPGTLALEQADIGHVGFRVSETASSSNRVRAVTVRELIETIGVTEVDLVKIDVEGAELELLSEETGWLEHVRAVSIEFHDSFRPGCMAIGQAALGAAGLRLRSTVTGSHYFVREAR